MQFFLKNVALFSLFAIMVSATSKFADSCREIEGYGSELQAECQEYENGQLRPTTINLNRCLKNHKGSLRCGSNGNYESSCINCVLRGTTDYECQCRNVDEGHQYVSTQIDLNKCISNNHGELRC
ncbi:uncharacterized protein N7498_000609 [Penicillium cinerascens]|uniref:Cyanovirin-N domain-containing protein n=1 Tax=Penicillium cinerascens TaxID=70096 RepID=A0A9W9TED1_9EURO|nr:uncharacterized protein N7498_000609 [Penicillium cinerascens]KAJ5218510.1 hypothetical protein N7498_000609 [Penicillium cinerascens]